MPWASAFRVQTTDVTLFGPKCQAHPDAPMPFDASLLGSSYIANVVYKQNPEGARLLSDTHWQVAVPRLSRLLSRVPKENRPLGAFSKSPVLGAGSSFLHVTLQGPLPQGSWIETTE